MFNFQWPTTVECLQVKQLDFSRLVILGVFSDSLNIRTHVAFEKLLKNSPQLQLERSLGEFDATLGQCRLLFLDGGKQLLITGLGNLDTSCKEALCQTFSLGYCYATRYLLKHGLVDGQMVMPKLKGLPWLVEYEKAIVEGALLGQDPTGGVKVPLQLKSLHVYEGKLDYRDLESLSHSVLLARRMVNTNADEMTPQAIAQVSKQVVKDLQKLRPKAQISCEILDEKDLEKACCGLILAVGRAAQVPPRLVILRYVSSKVDKREPILLVGKGITYDTGGLKLKPADSMLDMRSDMAGSAAVIGAFRAHALSKDPRPLMAVVVAAENAIGSGSFKLGDVYISHSGKTVEVTNTDAEGRLVLADAIGYATSRFKVSHLIDIATLTGGAITSLGYEAACLMSNDDRFANALMESAAATSERLWRMPLYKEYLGYLKSDVADLKNSGPRIALSSLAATFIQQFVPPNIHWAHIDIAPVAFLDKERGLMSRLATGFGVRLLAHLLANLPEK